VCPVRVESCLADRCRVYPRVHVPMWIHPVLRNKVKNYKRITYLNNASVKWRRTMQIEVEKSEIRPLIHFLWPSGGTFLEISFICSSFRPLVLEGNRPTRDPRE
jgi:hypothetical protein